MIQQIIRCKTIFSKLSDYDIDDNATMLSIYFDEEDSTFEMDKFKKPPLNVNTIDMISKCGIYSLYGNYTTKLIGNVYECLSAAINLERFWVKMNTDNTDWINFEKLILIDKEPELCIEYMKKSFTNKQKSRWDWLILHYNEDYYRMKMTDTDETIFKQMKMSKSNIA
jgi:hypothetical protein